LKVVKGELGTRFAQRTVSGCWNTRTY